MSKWATRRKRADKADAFIADMGRMNGALRPEENRGCSATADGAKASAVVYSLMLTCRACGVDPLTWLRHVLIELPQRDEAAKIDDLLPFNYATTIAAQ